MKHVFGMITQAVGIAVTYITISLSLVFDAIIFALLILLIYNFTFVDKFGAPELTYVDMVGLTFLIKVVAVLWKSVKVAEPFDEFTNNKQQLNEQQLNEQQNG